MNINLTSHIGRVMPIGAAALALIVHSAAVSAQPPVPTVQIGPLPLPVENVDIPGRTPFSTRSQILPAGGAGSCFGDSHCANYVESSTLAIFDLPTVPAGKRWVVVAATGGLINGASRTNQIELLDNRGGIVFDGLQWIFAGPFLPGSNSFGSAVFSEKLHAVFDEGETPSVRVSVPLTGTLSGYAVLVFHGYLEDIIE